MNQTKEIFIRLDRCVGCHTCELACAVEHSAGKNLFSSLAEKQKPRKRLFVEPAASFNVPVLCRHCHEAPCVDVCPTGATYHDEIKDLVLHDAKKCIGCSLCVQACPFGMMRQRAESRIAVKCDRCPDRDVPACVDSCPTKALIYADTESFGRTRRRAVTAALANAYLHKEAD
ncbi:MAG: 4Fe-4S dicluster domain-containing protein [Deltaproteobacteria bacterium]|nr:4Fe-4S dicluster domain-containing protein [Deltaproteobacteria bacterium]